MSNIVVRAITAAKAHLRVFGIAVLFGLSVYAALIVLDAIFRLTGLRSE